MNKLSTTQKYKHLSTKKKVVNLLKPLHYLWYIFEFKCITNTVKIKLLIYNEKNIMKLT